MQLFQFACSVIWLYSSSETQISLIWVKVLISLFSINHVIPLLTQKINDMEYYKSYNKKKIKSAKI